MPRVDSPSFSSVENTDGAGDEIVAVPADASAAASGLGGSGKASKGKPKPKVAGSFAATAAEEKEREESLYNFLLGYRVEKGCDHTHTSFARPSGAFYIPSTKHDEFMSMYKAALARGEDLYLTEHHRHIGPVVIDLDFRFEMTPEEVQSQRPVRRYNDKVVRDIVDAYSRVLADHVETPAEGFDVYVTEKSEPTMFKGLVKDGLHIVIPDVVTRPEVQLLVRQDVMKVLADVLKDMRLANRIDDVVDEAVIERNNWMMYGSKKPQGEAYKVTRKFIFRGGATIPVHANVNVNGPPEYDDEDFVERLSIRNKYTELPCRPDREDALKKFISGREEKRKRAEAVSSVICASVNSKSNECDNLTLVCKLVDCLDPARAESYNDWVRVGWCLRNIDHRLLEKWEDISKRSSKYVEGECARMWSYMRTGGLGIGTLHMWAKNDSPEVYKEIIRSDLTSLILRSASGTHHDVAVVVHMMFRYEYVCASIRARCWYEFRDHRWHETDSAYSLRKKISTDVFREYCREAAAQNLRAASCEDEDQAKGLVELSRKLLTISLQLKQATFKDNVMRECGELFKRDRFEDLLDSDRNLIGFENGVYDLERHEFREGRPDDHVSFSTGNNYIPYNKSDPIIGEITRFWESVHPQKDIRDYVLRTLSSCLSGHTLHERFNIWTGSGCHAFDTDIMMFDGSLKKVQDVAVNDELMGDDSTPRRVLELFRGSDAAMYRIVPTKGEPFVVNGDHVLSLKSDDVGRSSDDDVLDIKVVDYLRIPEGERRSMTLFRPDSVDFKARGDVDAALDPYVLGLWVGDGSGSPPHGGALRDALDLYGLLRDEKRIPADYLLNTKEVRQQVLAGILDSVAGSEDEFEVTLASSALMDDVVSLARSLGFACFKFRCSETMLYRARIEGECIETIPTVVHNKLVHNAKVNSKHVRRVSFTVERVEDGDFYGFELDGNHRYLMGDYTVTHNSNAKSVSVDLFERTFGDYCVKFPVTLLTQKRAASNAATSEIARAKGKRFAVLQEPSEDEKMNIGLMKELTGGDRIMARQLYKEPIEFKPQFKMFLLCNHLPNVPSEDGGTWRRIRVVEFGSKFVENPNPERPNEFPIDMDLPQKLNGWKEHFMAMLLDVYKRTHNLKLEEPEAVMRCTREYQRNNDHMADFMDTCLVKAADPGVTIGLDDIYKEFKEWVKADNIPARSTKKRDIQAYLDKTLPARGVSNAGRVSYRGLAIRDREGRFMMGADALE